MPDGVTLGYRKEQYEIQELKDFANSYNTINGLILRINYLLEQDDKLTRNESTVQGAINKLNDIIAKFAEIKPGDVAIVDAYGRVHGAPQTSAQGYGWTNIGMVHLKPLVKKKKTNIFYEM